MGIRNIPNMTNINMHAMNTMLISKIQPIKQSLKSTKIHIPVFLYGAEIWILDENRKTLFFFENEVLRKIFREGNIWRIKHNQELGDLFRDPDILVEAKSRRLRWSGHAMERDEDNTKKQLQKENSERRNFQKDQKQTFVRQMRSDSRILNATEGNPENCERWRQLVGDVTYHLGYHDLGS